MLSRNPCQLCAGWIKGLGSLGGIEYFAAKAIRCAKTWAQRLGANAAIQPASTYYTSEAKSSGKPYL
ncbi:hypothetical protein MY3296_006467 [Beauveria thailandica]